MEDELSQLDELIESDVLDALGEETLVPDSSEAKTKNTSDDIKEIPDEILIEDFEDSKNLDEENDDDKIISADPETKIENEETLEKEWESKLNAEKKEKLPAESESESESINTNCSDLASLLSKLLNNKTIEITIKIKD